TVGFGRLDSSMAWFGFASGSLCFDRWIRVSQFREIRRARPRVEFTQHAEIERQLFESRDAAIRVTEIAEANRFGWAHLLASRADLAVADRLIPFLGGDARRADALEAIGAFFHHSAPPDGHVRIAHGFENRRPIVGVLEEIEPADFVGAVVQT